VGPEGSSDTKTKTVVAAQLTQNPEDEAASAPAVDVVGSREVDRLEIAWARELVRQAREVGVVTGPADCLRRTKTVFETAPDEELCEHPWYNRHNSAG
jgi:hypothetical protein